MLHNSNLQEDLTFTENPEMYGVDDNNDLEITTANNVVIPAFAVLPTDALLNEINEAVPDSLVEDNNYGITHYLTIIDIVKRFL